MTLVERFMEKIFPEPIDGCWLWTGSADPRGYGHFFPEQRKCEQAHRFSYELYRGKIPEGKEIHHICCHKSCVNPEHLEALTHLAHHRLEGNAVKTHCPQGHPYSGVNLVVEPKNKRACRICKRETLRRSRARRGVKS